MELLCNNVVGLGVVADALFVNGADEVQPGRPRGRRSGAGDGDDAWIEVGRELDVEGEWPSVVAGGIKDKDVRAGGGSSGG